MSDQDLLRVAQDGVFLVPREDLATLVVRGADRRTWLNGLVTCDLAKATAERASYGLATTQKGRVLADVLVVVRPDELRVVVPAARRESLKAALEKYLIMEDAELELGSDVVAMAHGSGWRSLAGEGVVVVEHDELGLGGGLVLASSNETLARLEAPRATPAFVEALRVERGVPRFGVDFDESTYPQEASLERRAVAFDKGCYLGQEVVCMLELRGHVKRKLVTLTLEASADAGAKVVDESGVEQGAITSVAVGPETGARVGLAMVKLGKSEPGTRLRVGDSPAVVR